MAQLEMDRFVAWVLSTFTANMRAMVDDSWSDDDVLSLLDLNRRVDFYGNERFCADAIQRQWEAWQAALIDCPALRPMSTAPNDGTPILVRLEKATLGGAWQTVSLSPNNLTIGQCYVYALPPMIGWLPLPVIAETEVPDASK